MTSGYIREHDTHLARMESGAVGFYSLTHDGGSIRLDHLWILPQRMGQGIGRALFVHAVERARSAGFAFLEIESDPNAAGFYERVGARRVGGRVVDLDGHRRELPSFVYDLRLKE